MEICDGKLAETAFQYCFSQTTFMRARTWFSSAMPEPPSQPGARIGHPPECTLALRCVSVIRWFWRFLAECAPSKPGSQQSLGLLPRRKAGRQRAASSSAETTPATYRAEGPKSCVCVSTMAFRKKLRSLDVHVLLGPRRVSSHRYFPYQVSWELCGSDLSFATA